MAIPRDIEHVLKRLKFRMADVGPTMHIFQSKDNRISVGVRDNGEFVISKEEIRERGRGAQQLLAKLKGFLEVKVQEMTGTGGVGGFATPYAFATKGPISSKKKKSGYTVSESSNDTILKRFDILTEGPDEQDIFGSIQKIAKLLKSKGRKTDADNVIRTAHKFFKAGDLTMLIRTKESGEMILRSINEGQRGTVTKYLGKWKAINPKGTEEAHLKSRAAADEYARTGMVGGDPKWDEHGEYTLPINEGGDPYYAWRNDETNTPKQKIGGVISEINKQLREMEKVVRRSQRLKKEMGVPNSGLWKRTNNALMKIESRMHRISQTVRNMRG